MTREEYFAQHGSECFAYDPQAGLFYHKPRPIGLCADARSKAITDTKYAGRIAGRIDGEGYAILRLNYHDIKAHRYVWFLAFGQWPSDCIDHLNGNRSDNRIHNLREADQSLNRMNMALRTDNSSGAHGVFFAPSKSRWIAQICVRGKRKQIGSFGSFSDAHAARLSVQQQHEFGPNHGAAQ